MIDLSFITATIIKQPIIYHQNWMLAGYIFLSGTVVIHSEFLDNSTLNTIHAHKHRMCQKHSHYSDLQNYTNPYSVSFQFHCAILYFYRIGLRTQERILTTSNPEILW